MSCTRPATASSTSSGRSCPQDRAALQGVREAVDLRFVEGARRTSQYGQAFVDGSNGVDTETLPVRAGARRASMSSWRCKPRVGVGGMRRAARRLAANARRMLAADLADDRLLGRRIGGTRRARTARLRCGSPSPRDSTAMPGSCAGRVRQRRARPSRARSPAACDVDDLAERELVEVEEVRADVEQRAPLEPPAARVRAAGQERAREEAAASAERVDSRGRLGEAPQPRVEPVRQHDERADAASVRSRRRGAARRARSAASGFSRSTGFPASTARDREIGLGIGRDRDRDRVARRDAARRRPRTRSTPSAPRASSRVRPRVATTRRRVRSRAGREDRARSPRAPTGPRR